MLAVIFEVQPKPAEFDRYLDIARSLRPELEKMDGFVAIERFESRRRRGRVLSLSIWRDEAAVSRWRGLPIHRAAQQSGRSDIFADYRLRVAEITADSAADPAHPSARTATGAVTIAEGRAEGETPVDPGLAGRADVVEAEEFDSLYNKGNRLLLASWRDDAAARSWRPAVAGEWRQRRVRIIRDYGMFERGEAPQYYPPVPRPG